MLDQIPKHVQHDHESLFTLRKSIPFHCLKSSLTYFFLAWSTYIDTFIQSVFNSFFHGQMVNFTTPKTSTPTVIVSASHLNKGGSEHNSIAPWIEVSQSDNLLSPEPVSSRIKPYTNFLRERLISFVLRSTIITR